MSTFREKVSEVISKLKSTKLISLTAIVLLASAIPVTIFLGQKQQEIRQHAATNVATVSVNKTQAIPGDTITVGWNIPQNTPTCSITYSPTTITKDQTLGVTWNSTNATSRTYVAKNPAGNVYYTSPAIEVNGTLQDTSFRSLPAGVYTREDTVTGPGGSATCTATLTIQDALVPIVVLPNPTATPIPPPTPVCIDSVAVNSFYFTNNLTRYLTYHTEAFDTLRRDGWKDDGVMFYAFTTQAPGTVPVHSFYYSNHLDRYVTSSEAFFPSLIANGWTDEGVAFYAYATQVNGTVPIHVLSFADTQSRVWINSQSSVDSLVAQGWKDGGIMFYAFLTPHNSCLSAIPNEHQKKTASAATNKKAIDFIPKAYAIAQQAPTAPGNITGGESLQLFRIEGGGTGTPYATGPKMWLNCQTQTVGDIVYPPPSSPIYTGSCQYQIPKAKPDTYIIRLLAADGTTVLGESPVITITSNAPTPTCIPRPACLSANPACDIAENVNFCPINQPTGNPIPIPAPKPVYRFLYKANPAIHFFTINQAEADGLKQNAAWTYESIGWDAYETQQPDTKPVYHFYFKTNPAIHFFTMSKPEADALKAGTDWIDKGIAWYAFEKQAPGTQPVYRLVLNADKSIHFFTINQDEKNLDAKTTACTGSVPSHCMTDPWSVEGEGGVGFYAFPHASAVCSKACVAGKVCINNECVDPPLPPITGTIFTLDLNLTGIDATPKRLTRNVTIFTTRTDLPVNADPSPKGNPLKTGQVTYDPSTKTFKGQIGIDNMPSGQYQLRIQVNQYLRKLIPNPITIVKDQTYTLPQLSLTVGDANNDNKIDITDYNLLIGCYGTKSTTDTCGNGNNIVLTDFNDDGAVDGIDYNIFLRSLINQSGD